MSKQSPVKPYIFLKEEPKQIHIEVYFGGLLFGILKYFLKLFNIIK